MFKFHLSSISPPLPSVSWCLCENCFPSDLRLRTHERKKRLEIPKLLFRNNLIIQHLPQLVFDLITIRFVIRGKSPQDLHGFRRREVV